MQRFNMLEKPYFYLSLSVLSYSHLAINPLIIFLLLMNHFNINEQVTVFTYSFLDDSSWDLCTWNGATD